MRDYEEKSYYEIQLDNKQLILVFLAAVTVCVLIFVLGVMIGKGQKEAEMAAGKSEPVAQAQPEKEVQPSATPSEAQPPSEPLSQGENESEAEAAPVMEDSKREKEKPAVQKKAEKEPPKANPKESPKVVAAEPEGEPVDEEPSATENASAESEDTPGQKRKSGYTVQVIATSSKTKAQEQLSILQARGHTPQMDAVKIGSGTVYKVRVGRFADSTDAKALATRLKKELKIDTWVAVLD